MFATGGEMGNGGVFGDKVLAEMGTGKRLSLTGEVSATVSVSASASASGSVTGVLSSSLSDVGFDSVTGGGAVLTIVSVSRTAPSIIDPNTGVKPLSSCGGENFMSIVGDCLVSGNTASSMSSVSL